MESRVALAFGRGSGLSINFDDHENPDDPFPDIRTTTQGEAYYFELGEVTDQGHKWAESISVKTGQITGCAFSQLDPLLKMFREKCANSYRTDGAAVDLVLYFSSQPPYEPQLCQDLKIHAAEIDRLLSGSQFARVWLYSDHRPQRILWNWARPIRQQDLP